MTSVVLTISRNLEIRNKAQEKAEEPYVDNPIETILLDVQKNRTDVLSGTLDKKKLSITFDKNTLETGDIAKQFISFSLLEANTKTVPVRFSLKWQNEDISITAKNNNPQASQTSESQLSFTQEAKNAGRAYFLLTYNYSSLESVYVSSTVKFVWLNMTNGKWEELETENDENTRTITAKVNHFSNFGVSGQTASVFSPTLKNWETDTYTGALSYSMPIEVVPGIGGLAPALSLSYNTNKLKSLQGAPDKDQKGSWAGAGWDLTLPEIRFEKYNDVAVDTQDRDYCDPKYPGQNQPYPNPFTGATYSMVINGVSEELAWVGKGRDDDGKEYSRYITKNSHLEVKGYFGKYGNTEYYFNYKPTCLVQHNVVTKFVTYDTGGKKYTFDAANIENNQYNPSTSNRLIFINYTGNGQVNSKRMYPTRYMVTNIEDPSGNKIDFTYQVPPKSQSEYIEDRENPQSYRGLHHLSNYPKEIIYNNGQARIQFELEEKSNVPNPYPDDPPEKRLRKIQERNYDLYRLKTITSYSDWAKKTVYKKYVLNYFDKDTNLPRCDNSSCGENRRLDFDTLKKVDVFAYGLDEKNKLVPSEFSYQLRSTGFDEDSSEAPYITNVKNNYGGEVNVTYKHFYNDPPNHVRQFNFSVVEKKEIADKSGINTPAVSMLYSYDDFHHRNSVAGPNKGGGFGNVTTIDPITNIRNTTFYFPLSPATGPVDITADPSSSPFYGRPLRSVQWRCINNTCSDSKIYVYSDQYTLYGIKPVKTQNFDFEAFAGNEWWSNPMTSEMMKKGYVIPVTLATETFAPRYQNNVEGFYSKVLGTHEEGRDDERHTVEDLAYLYVDPSIYSSDTVIHNESRNYYDSYTRVIKSSIFSDLPVNWTAVANHEGKDFCNTYGNIFPSWDNFFVLSTSRQDWGAGGGQKWVTDQEWFGDSIKRGSCDTDDEGHPINCESCFRGWRSYHFTFGLPMNVKDFTNPGGNQSRYFPEVWTESGPILGAVDSNKTIQKHSYTKYVDSPDYLSKGFISLPDEAFVSENDVRRQDAFGNAIENKNKYSLTKNTYDGDGKIRGLLTSSSTKDTYENSERDSLYSADTLAKIKTIFSKTVYNSYGMPAEQFQTDENGNLVGAKTVTTYVNEGKPYDNLLPKEMKTIGSDGKIYSDAVVFYNDKWLPGKSTDLLNNVYSAVSYDCLGRLTNTYKPDPKTGLVLLDKPVASYYYFDYQGDGCAEGQRPEQKRLAGSPTTLPLPHLRTKIRISSTDANGSEINNYLYSDIISDGTGQAVENQILKTKIKDDFKSLVTETKYNNRGLKESESLPFESNAITLSSDTLPVPQYISLSDPQLTTYSYDELGRTLTMTDPLNHKTRTEYTGLITRSYDANNSEKSPDQNPTYIQTETNAADQTVKTIVNNIASGDKPLYALMIKPVYNNILGAVTSSTQYKCDNPSCNTTQMLYTVSTDYDNFGRKWKVQDPDLGTWKFAYDAQGNIARQIDAKNQEISFEYDPLKRLVRKVYPGNPRGGLEAVRNNIEFGYDTNPDSFCPDGLNTMYGKRMKMYDATGESSSCYDKRGRLTLEKKTVFGKLFGVTGADSSETEYEYYDSDALKATVLSNGERVERIEQTLNEIGQLQKVKSVPSASGATPFEILKDQQYDKFGAPLTSILGNNNLLSGRTYDEIGRIKSIYAQKDSNKLMDYQYPERDKVGNIKTLLNPPSNLSLKYLYDSVYQLTDVSGTYISKYTYSPEGDILTKSEGPDNVGMIYRDNTQRHAPKDVTINGIKFTYQYDANGNLWEDESRCYIWDYDNKPVRIIMKNSPTQSCNQASQNGKYTEFAYDGDGNRVLKRTAEPSPTPTITPTATPAAYSTPAPFPSPTPTSEVIPPSPAITQTSEEATAVPSPASRFNIPPTTNPGFIFRLFKNL